MAGRKTKELHQQKSWRKGQIQKTLIVTFFVAIVAAALVLTVIWNWLYKYM